MSELLKTHLEYPAEFDEVEIEEAQDVAPIVQRIGLGNIKTKEQALAALGNWYRYTEAKLEGKKAELKEVLEAAKSEVSFFENKIAFIERCIQSVLPPGKGSEYLNETVSLTYRRSERCIIEDAEAVPMEYCKLEPVPQVEKIKDILRSGGKVEGAKLTEHFNLQVKAGGDRAKSNQRKRLKKADELPGEGHEQN